MQFIHYKKYSFFFLLFTLSVLRGQDGTAKINLDRDEKHLFNFYAKDNGLWAFTSINTAFAQRPLGKVYKFSSDLSKQEWVIEMPRVKNQPIYDKRHPDYIYFQSSLETVVGRGQMKTQFYQIDKKGKVRMYEFEREKDKETDDHLFQFTSMNHFCEIWTKKKSANELILILHDNETFTKSKTVIQMPPPNKKKYYKRWFFAGAKDSLVALIRHDVDSVEINEVALINMKSGTVVKHFFYKPTLKDPNASLVMNLVSLCKNQANDNAYGLEDMYHDRRMNGALTLSENGDKFYYFAETVAQKTKKTPHRVGVIWEELDLDGHQKKQIEYEFSRKEMEDYIFDAINATRIFLTETDSEQISVELTFYEMKKSTRFSFLCAKDGTHLGKCLKTNYSQARFMQSSVNKVKSVEDLYPCFLKNPERINEYIAKKALDGGYNVLSDNDHHILSISVPEQQVIGFIYFHNK